MALLLETALGDVVIDLDYEGSPTLTRNVIQLAKADAYTRNLIYKVLPQRFCMTGCPVGDGSGGTSIRGLLKGTKTALSTSTSRPLSSLEMLEKGRVAVQGQSMGSQFLITIDQGKDHALDGMDGEFYSIGVVAEDDNNVLDKINAAYLDPNHRPYADIRILRALVVYDPFENDHSTELMEYIKQCPSTSPERPSQETVEKRISIADIDLENNDDDNSSVDERKQRELREEELKREAQSRAVVLEMLGDLPSADMKAPENVLFICKLNPVTTDEDLELIFSRFDQAVKVEIIRDHDTGDSLQYAFAEFTTPKQAQEAYFKMNNALVDDRRILVDFSQSVAKLWDKYHQKMKFTHSVDAYQSQRQQPNRLKNRENSKSYRRRENHSREPIRDERQRHSRQNNFPYDSQRRTSEKERYGHRMDHMTEVERMHKRDNYNATENSRRQQGGDYKHRSHSDHWKDKRKEDASSESNPDDNCRKNSRFGEGSYRRRQEEMGSHRRDRDDRKKDDRKRHVDDHRKHRREQSDSDHSSHENSRDVEKRKRRRDKEDRKKHKRSRHDDDHRRHRRERLDSDHSSHENSRDEKRRRRRDRDDRKKHKRSRHDDDDRRHRRERSDSRGEDDRRW